MTQDDVIEAIHEYADLLRQDAVWMKEMEDSVRGSGDARVQKRLGELFPNLRGLQRDYASLLRMCDLMERSFLEGKDWMAVKERMQKDEEGHRPRVAAFGLELRDLQRAASRVV